jgi:hypothetical protein
LKVVFSLEQFYLFGLSFLVWGSGIRDDKRRVNWLIVGQNAMEG